MSDNNSRKRSAPNDGGKKQWKKGRYFDAKHKFHQTLTGIEQATQGVFVTCVKGKEPRCVGEVYSLFEVYAEKIYGPFEKPNASKDDDDDDDDEELDIEAMMAKEIKDIRNVNSNKRSNNDPDEEKKMFVSVKLDTPCVVYFRTNPPISPSDFVHAICTDIVASGKSQSRWISRLTPIEQTGKATVEGIEEVARHVLKPHFHEGQQDVKFAIRPTIRNHDVLTRDLIINTVAKCVGLQHKVDLKNYDVLILVEIYKNICGMSVVKDWEKLKRFNLAQLQDADAGVERIKEKPQPEPKAKKDSVPKANETKHAPNINADADTNARPETEDQQGPGELALLSTLTKPKEEIV